MFTFVLLLLLLIILPSQAPDYYDIIKCPMDFMTMRTKQYRLQYHTPSDIVSDIRLMLSNCDLYNKEGTPERNAGDNLRRHLELRLREINEESRQRMTECRGN